MKDNGESTANYCYGNVLDQGPPASSTAALTHICSNHSTHSGSLESVNSEVSSAIFKVCTKSLTGEPSNSTVSTPARRFFDPSLAFCSNPESPVSWSSQSPDRSNINILEESNCQQSFSATIDDSNDTNRLVKAKAESEFCITQLTDDGPKVATQIAFSHNCQITSSGDCLKRKLERKENELGISPSQSVITKALSLPGGAISCQEPIPSRASSSFSIPFNNVTEVTSGTDTTHLPVGEGCSESAGVCLSGSNLVKMITLPIQSFKLNSSAITRLPKGSCASTADLETDSIQNLPQGYGPPDIVPVPSVVVASMQSLPVPTFCQQVYERSYPAHGQGMETTSQPLARFGAAAAADVNDNQFASQLQYKYASDECAINCHAPTMNNRLRNTECVDVVENEGVLLKPWQWHGNNEFDPTIYVDEDDIPHDVKSSVMVFHVPQSWTLEKLRTTFEVYGQVLQYRLDTAPDSGAHKGRGFVQFDSPDAANRATHGLNGLVVEDGRRLKVELKRFLPHRYRRNNLGAHMFDDVSNRQYDHSKLNSNRALFQSSKAFEHQQPLIGPDTNAKKISTLFDRRCRRGSGRGSFDVISAAIDDTVANISGEVAKDVCTSNEQTFLPANLNVFNSGPTSYVLPIILYDQPGTNSQSSPCGLLLDETNCPSRSNGQVPIQPDLRFMPLDNSKKLSACSPDKEQSSVTSILHGHLENSSHLHSVPAHSFLSEMTNNIYMTKDSPFQETNGQHLSVPFCSLAGGAAAGFFVPQKLRRNAKTCRKSLSSAKASYVIIPENNLFVFHIPPDWSEPDFRATFSVFGAIRCLRFPKDSTTPWGHRGYGFICYENYEDAVAAIREMDGREIEIGRRLKVEFKKPINVKYRHKIGVITSQPRRSQEPHSMSFGMHGTNEPYKNLNFPSSTTTSPLSYNLAEHDKCEAVEAARLAILMVQQQQHSRQAESQGLQRNTNILGSLKKSASFNSYNSASGQSTLDPCSPNNPIQPSQGFNVTPDNWPSTPVHQYRRSTMSPDLLSEVPEVTQIAGQRQHVEEDGEQASTSDLNLPISDMKRLSDSTTSPMLFRPARRLSSLRGELYPSESFGTLLERNNSVDVSRSSRPIVGLEDLDLFPSLASTIEMRPTSMSQMPKGSPIRRKSQRDRLGSLKHKVVYSPIN